jgi:hypothetical protein
MTIAKAQRGVSGGGERKKTVSPVVNGENLFFVKSTHGIVPKLKATQGMLTLSLALALHFV